MERDVNIIISGQIPSDDGTDAIYDLFLAELKVITLRYGLLMDEDSISYSVPAAKKPPAESGPLA
jgi:hypothetical protein